jgi:TPR repeat protein
MKKRNMTPHLGIFVAVDRKDARVQYGLGVKYEYGQGVPVDMPVAVACYSRAAAAGHDIGQAALGMLYAIGRGVAQDYGKAAKWFRKAAEQGNAAAQSDLGFLYMNGFGVEQDYGLAMKWCLQAAELGNETGQFNVGSMCMNGQGGQQDFVQAYKWFSLVMGSTDPALADARELAARNRERIAVKMTSEEISVAGQLVRDWWPKWRATERQEGAASDHFSEFMNPNCCRSAPVEVWH